MQYVILATADALRTAHATATSGLSCGGCDLNFFKDVFLNSADLFEANKLQKREKSYNYFQTRHNSAKQIRKTERSASRNTLQDRFNLVRDSEMFAKNFLQVLPGFDPFDDGLKSVDQLENANLAQRSGAGPLKNPTVRANIRSCSSRARVTRAAASLNFLCTQSTAESDPSADHPLPRSSSGGC